MSDLFEIGFEDYDYHDEYSITLGELIEGKVFKWKNYKIGKIKINLDWSDVAYDEAQYNRVCKMFIQRYYFDEIGITPPVKWLVALEYKIRYELMPKYRYLYALLDNGQNPFYNQVKWGKKRDVNSEFPETLLSNNADYASNATDNEYEDYVSGGLLDYDYMFRKYKNVDTQLIDDMKVLFNQMYSRNLNTF